MPRPLAGCSETLKCFSEALQCLRIYALSYYVLQRFTEALSNLTRPRYGWLLAWWRWPLTFWNRVTGHQWPDSFMPYFSFLRPPILDLGSGTGRTERQWPSV